MSVTPFLMVLSFPTPSTSVNEYHALPASVETVCIALAQCVHTLRPALGTLLPPTHRTLTLKCPSHLPCHHNPNPTLPCQLKPGNCPHCLWPYSPRRKVIGSRTRRTITCGWFKCGMLSSPAK